MLAQAGDMEAAGVLLDRYRNYLLLIANEEFDSDIQGKAGASDVVQDSMLHAQQHLGKFRGTQETEFRAWLRSILTNDLRQVRRVYSAQKRNVTREISTDADTATNPRPALLDPSLTPRSDALQRERTQAIESAMAKLSEDHRQVIELRNLEGLSFERIGQRMDRSGDAARKLWVRALESLRRQLELLAPDLVEDHHSCDRADD